MTAWKGVIAIEGLLSTDRRFVRHNALTWNLPVPVMRVPSDSAPWSEKVGEVHAIDRVEQGNGYTTLVATGTLDVEPPENREISAIATDAEFEAEPPPLLIFASARIMGVYLESPSMWPGQCVLEVAE